MIGIKPLFDPKSLSDGDTANFDVVLVGPDGKARSVRALHYQLLKVERDFQYYQDSDGSWKFEPISTTHLVNNGQLDLAADSPGRISLALGLGRYRLEVSTSDRVGPVSSFAFDAGIYVEASADRPDLLEIGIDKPEYRTGDTMTVAVTARSAGKLTVAVIGDKLLATNVSDVRSGTVHVPITVGSDWGSGAYVLATFRRPLDVPANRMPARSIGVQWFSIDRAAHMLAVDMTLPAVVRPGSAMRVPLKVSGITPGEDARIVVAAVDVGILNLTSYSPPAPDNYYLGQRGLAAEVRDLYGQLIDGMQGTRGPIRTGGDEGNLKAVGSPPTQPPLALYSGIVTVDRDGNAEITFNIPEFTGTARVMAVGWSKDRVGRATGDVIVRDPVVVAATLPRFLLTGDRSTLRIELDNVEGQAGDYQVNITGDSTLKVDAASQSIRLAAKQRTGINVPLTALKQGTGKVLASITGPGDTNMQKIYTLGVRPSSQILARRSVVPIAAGMSLNLPGDWLKDFVPGTGSIAVSIGASTTLDAATLLDALRRYPFSCTEQLTSRGLPLLYVSDLLNNPQPGSDEVVNETIIRLLTRQSAEGGFHLWRSPGHSRR